MTVAGTTPGTNIDDLVKVVTIVLTTVTVTEEDDESQDR